MATNTAGTDAQVYHTNQNHYLRLDITYADNGQTLSLGYAPAGSIVTNSGVLVSTAFNGDTTNTLNIGTADDPDGFASAIALGTVGRIVADDMATSNDLGPFAVDTEIKCVVTSTGSATAGAGSVYVEYLPRATKSR